MAILANGTSYAFVGEKAITVGDLTTVSSKTVTTTLPGYIDSSMVPIVTSTGLPDYGIGIILAWLSSPGASGTTLNIKLCNTGLATAVATDPVTFKIIVL